MSYLSNMNVETKESRYVGFCTYHKEYMTVKQMKFKECLFKKSINNTCPHLEKILEHNYWVSKMNKEKKKKLKSIEY